MSTQTYLDLAQQASKVEREKQWHLAADLWQLAFEKARSGHPNAHWAWARAEFCLCRKENVHHHYRS